MRKVDAAMKKHMNYIIYTENRPFSYQDFLRFEIDGKEYRVDHGTFRNKVSKLMNAGKIELEYKSRVAFYTIKGVQFGKRKSNAVTQSMTQYHTGVCTCHQSPRCHRCQQQEQQQQRLQQPQQQKICSSSRYSNAAASAATTTTTTTAAAPSIATASCPPLRPHPSSCLPSLTHMIQELPLDKNSLHDIRLRFEVPDIYTVLSLSLERANSHQPQLLQQQQQQQPQQILRLNSISKDIALPPWQIKGLNIKVTVHRTDTVSVVVGCSFAPVAADVNGVIRLSNALTRVEERLSRLLDDCGKALPGGYESLPIPDHSRWMVTMWHFGADASVEYTGEKFSATWEVGQNVLLRIYSKHMEDGNIRIRLERQEYPKKTLAAAIEEKLYNNSSIRGGGIS